ncbi:MAG: DNA-directed RNA polymerase subunit beta, partial [Candidatus Rokuibacteriota bacterium]
MAGTVQCGRRSRKDFGKIPSIVEIPNLIELQKRSYETFLQKDTAPDRREEIGLQAVFKSVFPIADYNDNALLEFDSYHFGEPKYSVEECHDRGMTFAIPLKVTLRLVVFDHDKEAKTRTIREQRGQEVYLGELPLMTEKGTFIINGTERVVVSQLQRSAGVFFDDDKGKTLASGRPLFSARVIPYRGSWVEFDFDANDVFHVRVDRRRKMLATAFLRAFWFLEKGAILTDEEILAHFYETEDVLGFEDGNAWVSTHAAAEAGQKVADDVKPPRQREPIITAGKVLTDKILEKILEAGVEKIAIRSEALVGRRTAARIVDTETGEVLVSTNTEITSTVLTEVMRRKVAPFKLLVVSSGKVDASIYDTLARDHFKNPDEGLVEIYRRLRPGDPPTVESARALFRGMFMDARRYDLARVGRFMINKKLVIDAPLNAKTLRSEDVVSVIRHLLMVKLGSKPTDDIDHLGNRRVRSVGELLENQFRVGLTRMERAVKERMSISDITNLMPHDLVNAKPVSAVVKEFFGSSQLSQFMDQTNPLAELTHKRRLSALGPRGLSRERAGFEV